MLTEKRFFFFLDGCAEGQVFFRCSVLTAEADVSMPAKPVEELLLALKLGSIILDLALTG
jgi:hypothetical protein